MAKVKMQCSPYCSFFPDMTCNSWEYDEKDPKEMEFELLNFAKENTAMYKCPRIFEFLPELPKTISGKIRRVEIRERDKGKDTDKIKQEF